MGAGAEPRLWLQRLTLYEVGGLRLMAAAIFQGWQTEYRRAAETEAGLLASAGEGRPDRHQREALLQAAIERGKAAAQLRWWRKQLERLESSETDVEAGETATLQDFIFDPADLWRYKHLALFVVEAHAIDVPDLDRHLPICRNSILWPREDLRALFEECRNWHFAPPTAKPEHNLGFGHQIEHVHWRNYLASYCEKPAGRGHPKGARWQDGRSAAANHAWSLLWEAEKAGRILSISEAVRRSVSRFKLLKPSDPEPLARDAEDFIRASSPDQAEKAVRKALDILITSDSPFRHVGEKD